MYNVEIVNDYIMPIEVKAVKSAIIGADGGKDTFDNVENMIMEIPGMGEAVFIYLGESRLPGYPDEPVGKFGVLVRFHNVEIYYRYDGTGQIHLVFDHFGTMLFDTEVGSAIAISLPEVTLNGQV